MGDIIPLQVENTFRKMTDIQGTPTVQIEKEEELRRNKLSHHEQYLSSGGKRHSPRNRSPTRANAKIHHNTKQKPIECSSYC